MILDEIIFKIGKENFFSIDDLSRLLNLNQEDTDKFIKEGISRKIIIEVLQDEYAFSENTIQNFNEEDKEEFSKWIDENLIISNSKAIKLSLEETELRDSVLMDLAVKRRAEASETLVNHIEKNNTIISIRDDIKNETWIYRNGIYVPQGESFTREFCRKILGQAYTNNFVNIVLEKIRADNFKEADDFFREETNYIDEIPVKNGILNIKTKKLSIFTPRKTFFNKINAIYDPSAKCPNINHFLSEVLKNPEDIKIAYEIIGVTLYKKYFPQMAVGLLGEGENGKGVFTNLIRTFLGVQNCASLPLNQLTPDSFSVAELFGKLVNIPGDVGNNDLKDTGRFKELTSGTDLITAKRKFQRDLFFDNYAKMIFPFNELPRVYDFSHGFWRRWVILEFPYQFVKQNEYNLRKEEINIKLANPEIINELTTPEELSGLLNEALEGLARVLKNKQFSITKSTQDLKDFWIRKSDSFTAFCMDMIEEDFEGYISKKSLRSFFNKYCKKYKVKGTSDKNIKVVLENQFGVIESRKTTENGFENVWEGIRFKPTIKDIRGFSTYIEKKISPIGEKTIDILDSSQKKQEILAFFEKNPEKMVSPQEIPSFPLEILKELQEEGKIFSPKKDFWQYLG